METKKEKSFKEKILEEMTVSYANSLEKNFELAKKFIRITEEGRTDLIHKDKLTGIEQILLYLIGKLYAKEAGKTLEASANNEELAKELMIPIGSLLPWLKKLRDSNKIVSSKDGKRVAHYVRINLVEKILENIDTKLKSKMK